MPVSRQEALKRFRSLQTRSRCYHPNASTDGCGTLAVAAHTVPAAMLKLIARSGHVYSFPRSLGAIVSAGGSLSPKLVGINKASTFPLFCAKHDSALFEPIETGGLRACEEHAFLLAFRAVVYELYAKEAGVISDSHRRELDKGLPTVAQVALQALAQDMKTGFDAALRDLRQAKAELDQMWLNGDFLGMEYCTFWFASPPDVMCCACASPPYDFIGKPLEDLGDLDARMPLVTVSMLGSRERGCAFFAWSKHDSQMARPFVRSLITCGPSGIPHAMIRYTFGETENAYLRPEWWEQVDEETRKYLVARVHDAADLSAPIRPNGLVDDGVRAGNWNVAEFDSNVPDLRTAWENQR